MTIAPLLIDKDLGELANQYPNLSNDERERLIRIGHEEGQLGFIRIAAALGDAYAQRLTVKDLAVLVRQNESPEAIRRRAAEPSVLLSAISALGSLDPKKSTAARMCKEIKKSCDRN